MILKASSSVNLKSLSLISKQTSSLNSLLNSYTPFVNNGHISNVKYIKNICDNKGNIIYKSYNKSKCL